MRLVPHTVPARSHERSGTDRKFSISVREVTSLPTSSKGNLAFLHKVTQCQLLTGSHFFIIRFELWIPIYPQDGTNLSHCAINNNSGPGIDSPTSHQNPGFRGPTALVPLPTDDWQPRAERVTAGGRSQAGLNPTWLASASIQYSRSAGAASIRVVSQVNITRQWQVP